MSPTVRFSHSDYLSSHGRPPRGEGSWVFQFNRGGTEPWWAPGVLTLTEAKKLARAEAVRRGANVAEVCP